MAQVVKESAFNAGDSGLILGWEDSLEGLGNLVQYSYWIIPMVEGSLVVIKVGHN